MGPGRSRPTAGAVPCMMPGRPPLPRPPISAGDAQQRYGGRPRHAAAAGPVVVDTGVDEPYVRPLVDECTHETVIAVTLLTDAEASKGVGLAEKLRAERDHPRADVWWSNECFLTINLADEGVLAAYESPSAGDIPSRYKDPRHRWAGSILRVRMLVASPSRAGEPAATPPLSRLTDLL